MTNLNHGALPAPLTPADCNLRGMPYMPMKVAQVLQSETFGLTTGDEFKAAFALWCASWMEVPAASLPNDERMLDFLSRSKTWKKVRDMALRGWVLCEDGRLYHPVIAEAALDAWDKRSDFRDKEDSKNGRQQRWRDQCKQLAAQLRDMGVTPPRGASLKTLQGLIASHTVDGGVDVEPSTYVDAETSTVDDVEIGKEVEVKREVVHGVSTPPTRVGEICILLRRAGVNTSPDAVGRVDWSANPKATDDLVRKAVETAKKRSPRQITPAYLTPIISDLLAEADAVEATKLVAGRDYE
jgi:hypothetical protein